MRNMSRAPPAELRVEGEGGHPVPGAVHVVGAERGHLEAAELRRGRDGDVAQPLDQ